MTVANFALHDHRTAVPASVVPDLLVRLYALPPLEPALQRARAAGVEVRRARASEKLAVCDWVKREFSAGWADEAEVSFARQPLACFVARHEGGLCGFAAYEATCRGFFGPIGVAEQHRSRHAGEALLLAALNAMFAEGHAYAIIGAAGPVEFFQKIVGATVIEGSEPGIY